ncbi:unnamed protein product, partial [Ectocarpus sp. 12 AP-2014]
KTSSNSSPTPTALLDVLRPQMSGRKRPDRLGRSTPVAKRTRLSHDQEAVAVAAVGGMPTVSATVFGRAS